MSTTTPKLTLLKGVYPITLQIDGAASLGSEILPLGGGGKSKPFDGFHRAVVPEVLKP